MRSWRLWSLGEGRDDDGLRCWAGLEAVKFCLKEFVELLGLCELGAESGEFVVFSVKLGGQTRDLLFLT